MTTLQADALDDAPHRTPLDPAAGARPPAATAGDVARPLPPVDLRRTNDEVMAFFGEHPGLEAVSVLDGEAPSGSSIGGPSSRRDDASAELGAELADRLPLLAFHAQAIVERLAS